MAGQMATNNRQHEDVVKRQERSLLAFQTWLYDLSTTLLTAIYCGIAFHDIGRGRAVLTSPQWFDRGFCVWEGGGWNSHQVCFVGDLLVGGVILGTFGARYQRESMPQAKEALQLVMAVAAFTIMHGLGHLFIGEVLGENFMQTVRPDRLSYPLLAVYYLLLCGFLALGPYLGHRNGIPMGVCLAVHMVVTFLFMQYVPNQFAFGAVQLYLNGWYCLPRVALIGWEEETEIGQRIEDGWNIVSGGFLLLMPVVFIEMMACDSFLSRVTGHFCYDGSILLIIIAHSWAIWRQLDQGSNCAARKAE